MASGKRLIDQLCQVISAFLCPSANSPDIEKCSVGPHIFSRGSSQAICTVKLVHGEIYHLEFVYRYWGHILEKYNYPFSPMFIICNNGLAVTLKCYICEPRDLATQYGQTTPMASDVNLQRNSYVVLCQDDFIKFKTPLVFAKDLDITNSMVVCRTYLTSNRQSLQFLVVKSKNPRRLGNVLDMIKSTVRARGPGVGAKAEEAEGTQEAPVTDPVVPSRGPEAQLHATYNLPAWPVWCALLAALSVLGLMTVVAWKLLM
nr:ORF67 terminase complex component [Ovine gammaherpesvirus 2]